MTIAPALWDDLLAAEEVAYLGSEPERNARGHPFPVDLDERVAEALAARGVDSLYAHQLDTWEAASRDENVVVATGTASGKTLAFNLPGLDALARDP